MARGSELSRWPAPARIRSSADSPTASAIVRASSTGYDLVVGAVQHENGPATQVTRVHRRPDHRERFGPACEVGRLSFCGYHSDLASMHGGRPRDLRPSPRRWPAQRGRQLP